MRDKHNYMYFDKVILRSSYKNLKYKKKMEYTYLYLTLSLQLNVSLKSRLYTTVLKIFIFKGLMLATTRIKICMHVCMKNIWTCAFVVYSDIFDVIEIQSFSCTSPRQKLKVPVQEFHRLSPGLGKSLKDRSKCISNVSKLSFLNKLAIG